MVLAGSDGSAASWEGGVGGGMLVEERGAQAPPSPAAEVPGPHGGEENIFLSMLEKQGSEGGGLQVQEAALPPLPWGAEGGQGPRPDTGTGKGAGGSGPRGAETPRSRSLNLSAGSRSQRCQSLEHGW